MTPDPEIVQDDYTAEAEKPIVEVNIEPVKPYAATSTDEQWRQYGKQISAFIADLPSYISDFFGEYQRPLITVGLILAAFIAVKLTLAVLDAINDIPLIAPTFELIGIAYTAWFVYRYLLSAASRQELSEEVKNLKEQYLGKVD